MRATHIQNSIYVLSKLIFFILAKIIGGGSASYLYQDYSVSCDGARYKQYLPLMIILIMVFPVG